MTAEIIPFKEPRSLSGLAGKLPAVFLPDEKAAERFFGYVTANIRNKNTRAIKFLFPAGWEQQMRFPPRTIPQEAYGLAPVMLCPPLLLLTVGWAFIWIKRGFRHLKE